MRVWEWRGPVALQLSRVWHRRNCLPKLHELKEGVGRLASSAVRCRRMRAACEQLRGCVGDVREGVLVMGERVCW